MSLEAPCPSEDTLQEFVENRLSEAASRALIQHADTCGSCRTVLSAWAQTAASGGDDAALLAAASQRLPPGTSIGRFLVLERLGEGAMGIVYAAFDPTLDRKVALKLLRPSSSQSPERLLQEAKALARISHPHVVTVFDAGVHEREVYVAMELVDGVSLRRWLSESRKKSEVLRVFIDTALGIAAAHAAGIVHRDLKPENIVIGNDGRIRVTDFGLASLQSADVQNVPRPGSEALLGTPVYMSPEQLQGRATDHRTDQFSLCVALCEALTGQRPFQGSSVEALRRAVEGSPALAATLSRPLRRLLLRGLALRPEDRFESMESMIHALRQASSRFVGRHRWAIAAAASAVAVSGAFAFQVQPSRICSGAASSAREIWNPEIKLALQAALERSGAPFAAETWHSIEQSVDRYASDWVKVSTESCLATRVTGERTELLLDASSACLQRRLLDLKSLLDVLASADKAVAARAPTALSTLPALEPCTNLTWLGAQVKPPTDTALAAKVESVRKNIARAGALQRGGKYADALEIAEHVQAAAASTGHAPLIAEAHLLNGELLGQSGRWKEARAALAEAVYAGEAVHHDEVTARASVKLIGASHFMSRHEEGHHWARLGEAVLTRLGHPALEYDFHEHLAVLLYGEGKLEASLQEHAKALARAGAQPNPEYAEALVLLNSGAAHDQLNHVVEARESFERAAVLFEKTLGPNSPRVAGALLNLAGNIRKSGRSHETGALIERAKRIMVATYGPGSPFVADVHVVEGRRLLEGAEPALARKEFLRSIEITAAALGPKDPRRVQAMLGLSAAAADEGQAGEALRLANEALAAAEKAHGPLHADAIAARKARGQALSLAGRHAGAWEDFRAAVANGEAVFGKDDLGVVADARVGEAELLLALRRPEDALKVVSAVIALREARFGSASEELVAPLATSARALRALGRGAESRRHATRGRELCEAAFGPKSARTALALKEEADALLGNREVQLSITAYERALTVLGDRRALDRAQVQLGLARALRASGENSSQARSKAG